MLMYIVTEFKKCIYSIILLKIQLYLLSQNTLNLVICP